MRAFTTSLHRVVALVSAVIAAGVVSGCVARFQGEIDGQPVPPFSTAAFGLVDGQGGQASITGFAVPGDSCSEAVELARLTKRQNEATSNGRIKETATDVAAWYARVLPRGEWSVQLAISAAGKNLLGDSTIDLDDTDTDVFVNLNLCRSDDDAKASDGFFFPDLDCYRATDGAVQLALDETAGTMRVIGDEPIEFRRNGQDEGSLLFEMTFAACDELSTALEEVKILVGGDGGGGGGRFPEPQPPEANCFEQCSNGTCEVICDKG